MLAAGFTEVTGTPLGNTRLEGAGVSVLALEALSGAMLPASHAQGLHRSRASRSHLGAKLGYSLHSLIWGRRDGGVGCESVSIIFNASFLKFVLHTGAVIHQLKYLALVQFSSGAQSCPAL